MKVIFIYTDEFAFKIGSESAKKDSEDNQEQRFQNVQTAFIHVESPDEESENSNRIVTKFIKQAKWVARKNNTNHIILHSVAHLSDSKSTPEFAKMIFDNAQERLETAGFVVNQTPFGHFLDLDMKAPGRSLARVFYEIN